MALALSACNLQQSQALWRTNGTAEGTSLVVRLPERVGASWAPPVAVGREIFFLLNDGGNDHVELWNSDGTAGGTGLVRDLSPSRASGGSLAGDPEAVAVGDTLFFVLEDPAHGSELWRSDGTADGTHLVRDIVPGPDGSAPRHLQSVGDRLLFFVGLRPTGPETRTFIEPGLWSSDGTSAGTQLLQAGIVKLRGSTDGHRGGLFLTADGLWRTDGTSAGTRRLTELSPVTGSCAAAIGDSLLARADVLYAIDASAGQPRSAQPIATIPGLCTDRFVPGGDSTYFTSTRLDGTAELWRSDGTPAGTVLVRRFSHGLGRLTAMDSTVYFAASTPETGTELWRTDGTPAGTRLVTDLIPGPKSGSQEHRIAFDGRLLFTSTAGLYTTDGTAAGTVRIHRGFHNADFALLDGSAYWLRTELGSD
ncbi:MAG: ELWxxDGT repeat protein [Thermoanaerobaculia bacterium]